MNECKVRCGDCRFWEKLDEFNLANDDGICRRYPPSLPPTKEEKDISTESWFFPITLIDEWCGEFQPKRLADDQDNEFLDAPIDELKLSVRAHGVAVEAICRNLEKWKDPILVRDLVKLNVNWLLDVKNCGIKTLEEIRTKLAAHGLRLKDDNVAATTPAS